jgi:hypothetical protein
MPARVSSFGVAWSRTSSIAAAAAVVVAVMATAGQARAQALAAVPVFPVEIVVTQPGARIVLRAPGGEILCGERCVLNLPQSSYKMVVQDRDGSLSTQKLFVEMPTRAAVTPADPGTRRLGVVMMGVGLAGMVVGYVVFLAILFRKWTESAGYCGGDCPTTDFDTSTYVLAGASLGVGLALGVTGMVMWRRNSHAEVRTSLLGAPPTPTAAPSSDVRLRLTPAAGPRWAGLALTGSF